MRTGLIRGGYEIIACMRNRILTDAFTYVLTNAFHLERARDIRDLDAHNAHHDLYYGVPEFPSFYLVRLNTSATNALS